MGGDVLMGACGSIPRPSPDGGTTTQRDQCGFVCVAISSRTQAAQWHSGLRKPLTGQAVTTGPPKSLVSRRRAARLPTFRSNEQMRGWRRRVTGVTSRAQHGSRRLGAPPGKGGRLPITRAALPTFRTSVRLLMDIGKAGTTPKRGIVRFRSGRQPESSRGPASRFTNGTGRRSPRRELVSKHLPAPASKTATSPATGNLRPRSCRPPAPPVRPRTPAHILGCRAPLIPKQAHTPAGGALLPGGFQRLG